MQQEEQQVHDGNGQEVADGGHEQSAAWPGPVQHRVDVRLSPDVGAVSQVVDDGERSVRHPEQDRVDKVQEAGRRRRQDEVEDDVDGIHGVEGKVYGADCFVTCTQKTYKTLCGGRIWRKRIDRTGLIVFLLY